ncbi:MAG: glycosyltransferase family 4 protein [Candidatus Omnitrophica bacterium]|nr:glycosyltransferase family 4 protein [Candidatus Omnitrophota bacterium]
MKIGIHCRSIVNRNYTGIGRYTWNLFQHLAKIDSENRYLLYVPRALFHLRRRTPKVNAKNFFVKVDHFKAGVEKTLGKIDVYHSPSPDDISVNGAKMVVTVHDLIYKTFPQGHTDTACAETDRKIAFSVKNARKIICCSQNTIADLKKYFSVEEGKIELIYQGIDHQMFYQLSPSEKPRAKALLRLKGIQDPFILFVGTIEPRKNLKNLLVAFSKLKDQGLFKGKLVAAGMKGWLSEDIANIIKKYQLETEVLFPGFVTDEELRALYNEAEVFVFPSFYEGFGFPIIEAFSCGAPVVTSQISSCPEVAQDAAALVDPYNPDDLYAKIVRVLNDRVYREELSQKGFKRAQDFNFEKTARETLKIYQSLKQ